MDNGKRSKVAREDGARSSILAMLDKVIDAKNVDLYACMADDLNGQIRAMGKLSGRTTWEADDVARLLLRWRILMQQPAAVATAGSKLVGLDGREVDVTGARVGHEIFGPNKEGAEHSPGVPGPE